MKLLNNRFEIVEQIGRGSQAITHKALDHETGEEVAIKELDFRRVGDWKAQELFEREGATLRSLNHDAIPSYIDAFAVESEDTIQLFLVQEFIDGETLQDELDRGKRWTEEEAIDDALQLLDALTYLHRLAPPVIHRDIKPSNIIRRRDGRLALVDFGAVQNILQRTVGGSTIIGTPGYMPIEQVMGRAVAGTDLYALGATIIHLLTRTDPSELPVVRNQLQFRDRVPDLSDAFAAALDRLTQPSVEDRFATAAEAREQLVVGRNAGETVFDNNALTATPTWATVTGRDEKRLIAFEARGDRDQLVHASIEDWPDRVGLRLRTDAWRPRGPGIAGFGAVLVTMVLIGGLPLLPLVFMALVMAAAVRRGTRGRWARRTTNQLRFEMDDYRFTAISGGRRVKGSTKELAGAFVVDNTLILRLQDGRGLELLTLDPSELDRLEWLAAYFNHRIADLNTTQLVAEQEDSRVQFWLEQPVSAK